LFLIPLSLSSCAEQASLSPSQEGIEFVVVVRTSGVPGGMTEGSEAVYVDSSGFVQASREGGERVLELREAQGVALGDVFSRLGRRRHEIEALELRATTTGPAADFVPDRIYLAVGSSQRAVIARESDVDDVPELLARLLGVRSEVLGSLRREAAAVENASTAYLRALPLPPVTAERFRRDRLTVSLTGVTRPAGGALERAVARPGRLVAVSGEANPFSPFHNRFVPGRSTLEIEIDGGVFQVRTLRVGVGPARAEGSP
jgi:hypothetical protein